MIRKILIVFVLLFTTTLISQNFEKPRNIKEILSNTFAAKNSDKTLTFDTIVLEADTFLAV